LDQGKQLFFCVFISSAWVNRVDFGMSAGAPWHDLRMSYGPRTTCNNGLVRCRRADVRGRITDPLAARRQSAWANIPPKRNRIEIKQCRRGATRYDKLAANDLAFVKLASIRIWLRANAFTPWLPAESGACNNSVVQ
jgi:transposase